MHVLVIRTGLFPDDPNLAEALEHLQGVHRISRFDATQADLDDADWERAVEQILDAERVITI
jgi:DNA-binding MurR/RpiR family transcriptional regulator